MSKLDELIKILCPNGVVFKTLEELGKFYSGLTGKTKEDFKDGNANFITYKNIFNNPQLDLHPIDKVKIFPGEKQRKIAYMDVLFTGSSETPEECAFSSVVCEKPSEDCYLNSFCFAFELYDKNTFNPHFLKHLFRSTELRKQLIKTANGVTRFNVSKDKMKKVRIPVPPMEVQCEIVRILNNFTELAAELATKLVAELTARRKQYEYYRDNLILNNGYPRVKLSDIATDCFRGAGIKRDEVTEEGTPCIRYGEIYTSYGIFFDKCISHTDSSKIQSKKVLKKNDILFAITGESVDDIAKSTAYVGEEEGLVGGDIVVLRHNQNAKYLAYALSTADAVMQKGLGKVKSKVVHSNAPSILAIEIPLPSLEEQQKIVDILDNFDRLTNDIFIGISSEINCRTQQYEYYRDKLLTFKELKK